MISQEQAVDESTKEVEFLSRKILDLNKKLIKSEKAKSGFLSLVASELNNPMTALLGLVPRLKPLVDSPQYPIFDLVYEQVLQLNFLIENVVAAAEIESGESTLSHAQTHISQIVDEIINEFRYKLGEKALLFEIESEKSEPIVTDPQKIDLIVKNLIANACMYADTDSVVRIILEQSNKEYSIRVENMGKGADIRYEAELFNRFLDAPHGHHGLGLGLSIVRNYTELLGGNMRYKASDGKVLFSVILPLNHKLPDSCAIGSDEFIFESFDDAIEL